jgi:hypothetical protein
MLIMRGWIAVLFFVLLPVFVCGQERFSADGFSPNLSGDGLLAVRGAAWEEGRWTAALELDTAHHLLGVREGGEGLVRWIVEDRLSLRLGVGYSPASFLWVEAGVDGVPFQQGERTDALGIRVPLEPAMGSMWFSTVWALPEILGPAVQSALGFSLIFPAASPAGLAGGDRLDLRIDCQVGVRAGLVHPVLNFGIASASQVRFQNLVRSDAFLFGAGIEVGGESWPIRPSLEMVGAAQIPSFSRSEGGWMEALAGAKLLILGEFETQFGAGVGLVGIGAPAVRGMLIIRWLAGKKRATFSE